MLLVPPAALLGLVSWQSGYNHHVRYVLPVLGFAFIWAAGAARWPCDMPYTSRGWRRLASRLTVGGLAAWSAASSLWYYPHSISYFNELVGGPAHGPKHLLDSNIDWGQDLLLLRRWLERHPQAHPLRLAYFGNLDPRAVGIPFLLPPFAPNAPPEYRPAPGWYAVSVNFVYGYSILAPDGDGSWRHIPPGAFAYFQRLRPADRCGWSIYLYHVE
jgi:hypothetical protein